MSQLQKTPLRRGRQVLVSTQDSVGKEPSLFSLDAGLYSFEEWEAVRFQQLLRSPQVKLLEQMALSTWPAACPTPWQRIMQSFLPLPSGRMKYGVHWDREQTGASWLGPCSHPVISLGWLDLSCTSFSPFPTSQEGFICRSPRLSDRSNIEIPGI